MRCLTLALVAAGLTAGTALAQIASGPTVGEAPPPLKVYAATGPQETKELDYAAHRAAKPTVYVLISDFDRPVARFLKMLDGAVKEESAEGEVVAVWLTEKQAEIKAYLPRVQMSLKMEVTSLALFPGDKNGPENWNVNPDARVTVAVAGKGKVAATFGYASVNETDVREVRMALKKAL